MSKAKRSAIQQLEDEAARRAFNGIEARQVIAEHISTPEFHLNRERLKAERLSREAKAASEQPQPVK